MTEMQYSELGTIEQFALLRGSLNAAISAFVERSANLTRAELKPIYTDLGLASLRPS